MCGICGLYNYGSGLAVTREVLKPANDLLERRGPDDEGYYCAGDLGLAMRRLSIIDFATGHQPLSNEDGSVWTVLNGEIYNFAELRSALLARGHRFSTRSDTETIVHLYEEYGDEFPEYLRGMFACAVWDAKRGRLLLARDRVGKKPLFYCRTPGFIAFASELRALTAFPGVPREMDPAAVDSFLALQYIPSPLSVYRGVRKLEPASLLAFEKGEAKISRYWDLPLGAEKFAAPAAELKERLCAELSEAVRLRLVAEVPLGAFLSGGIDSSVVTALMARSSDKPVKTFSIGFREEAFSELPYARQVAEMYGTEHTEFTVEADMASELENIVRNYGEPYADPSALPSYFVARETRRHVTVALNGDGGDEAFGGYLRYAGMKAESAFAAGLPAGLKRSALRLISGLPKEAPFGFFWRLDKILRLSLQGDEALKYLYAMSFIPQDELGRLYAPGFVARLGRDRGLPARRMAELFAAAGGEALLDRMVYADAHTYLCDNLMTKMDIATMSNSLEGRSPFLDHKVLEFAWRLPPEMRLRGFRGTKWLLKEAFREMLPPGIYRRGKMGFGIPLGPWFRGQLKKRWEETCLSPGAVGRGYFKESELRRLWDEHQGGRADHGYKLWALLMLELWHRQFAPDFKV